MIVLVCASTTIVFACEPTAPPRAAPPSRASVGVPATRVSDILAAGDSNRMNPVGA